MPRLMTFGDSNTFGTPPMTARGTFARYGRETRWPTRAAKALGPDWELIEEGLPGRTTAFCDPVMGDHLNGQIGFRIALCSHGPLDALTIMLGTNDVKPRMMADPRRILGGIAGLIDMAFSPEMTARHPGLRILLIAPPPVIEAGVLGGDFHGGKESSSALAGLYRDYARARGIGFLDAGAHVAVSPVDGVHWEPEGHAAMAEAVTEALKELMA